MRGKRRDSDRRGNQDGYREIGLHLALTSTLHA
jgi:hypothetical protein